MFSITHTADSAANVYYLANSFDLQFRSTRALYKSMKAYRNYVP